jgi:hypothetical protein
MIWNCLTAKEAQFEDEREVRGIVMNVRAKFDPWRRTHADRHYVEHVLPLKEPGSITEILVGPDAAVDAEARVRAMLEAEGYPDTIPVRRGHAGDFNAARRFEAMTAPGQPGSFGSVADRSPGTEAQKNLA